MAESSCEEFRAEIRRLKAENARLTGENEWLRKRTQALEQQVEGLTERIQVLTEALEKTHRAGKRQAAPFSKGEPAAEPKPPGRKAGKDYGRKGHRLPPAPEAIDEVCDAPLPESCDCGGTIEETHTVSQYQTEIPRRPIHREFRVHLGTCTRCGRSHQGRHPLQTSDALGAAAAQLGPETQAAAVILNKQAGLSDGKVAQVFQNLFGVSITRGGVAQVILRAGRRCRPAYEQIRQSVRSSPWIVPDETGWRVGGRPHWLHVLVGSAATCYLIDKSRSAEVAAKVLGWDYPGLMTHDGWSSYDRFHAALHQQCLAHPLRRARELRDAARGLGKRFPQQVISLFQNALACRDLYRAGQVSLETLSAAAPQFVEDLKELTAHRLRNPDQARFARHLANYAWSWFAFLVEPQLDATNHQAEQALRGAVVNRKVWGGNRTAAGKTAQAVLMSILETCRRHGQQALEHLGAIFRDLSPPLPGTS